MARTNFVKNFDLCFEIPFSTIIRGYHIYKTIWRAFWRAFIGQELIAKPDEREEALDCDKFSIGVFKSKREENKINTSDALALEGLVPIKISSLLYYYLKSDKDSTNMSKLLEFENVKLFL